MMEQLTCNWTTEHFAGSHTTEPRTVTFIKHMVDPYAADLDAAAMPWFC